MNKLQTSSNYIPHSTIPKFMYMNSTCKIEAEHMSSQPRRKHHSVLHGGPMFWQAKATAVGTRWSVSSVQATSVVVLLYPARVEKGSFKLQIINQCVANVDLTQKSMSNTMTSGFLKWTSHWCACSFITNLRTCPNKIGHMDLNASGESHTFQIAAASGSIVAL